MPFMPSQIEIYEEMSALSTGMVEAARTQDWERLVDLESRVSALRDALMAGNDSAALTPHEASLKAALIRRILEDDAEIRRHTEPWMEHVRQYLSTAALQRRVSSAYGDAMNSFGSGYR